MASISGLINTLHNVKLNLYSLDILFNKTYFYIASFLSNNQVIISKYLLAYKKIFIISTTFLPA